MRAYPPFDDSAHCVRQESPSPHYFPPMGGLGGEGFPSYTAKKMALYLMHLPIGVAPFHVQYLTFYTMRCARIAHMPMRNHRLNGLFRWCPEHHICLAYVLYLVFSGRR